MEWNKMDPTLKGSNKDGLWLENAIHERTVAPPALKCLFVPAGLLFDPCGVG